MAALFLPVSLYFNEPKSHQSPSFFPSALVRSFLSSSSHSSSSSPLSSYSSSSSPPSPLFNLLTSSSGADFANDDEWVLLFPSLTRPARNPFE